MRKSGYNNLLQHVIEGLKEGVPVTKTLKKHGWSSATFYYNTSDETKRMFKEIKCLKQSKVGRNKGGSFVESDYADFNKIDVGCDDFFDNEL